jgi:demethylmenaquinone methyltransferase/2-methoxy-6-polyprenyl-1,4-benzoquinol methylase
VPVPCRRQTVAPSNCFAEDFFSFWLSHVPPGRFEAFWRTVAAALKPGGRAFFVDSLPDETSAARDHRTPDADGVQERLLNDGRSFRVLKLFHEPRALEERLRGLGWRAAVGRTSTYFLHGSASRG